MTDEAYACLTSSFLVQEFLRAEGFTDIEYVKIGNRVAIDLLRLRDLGFIKANPNELVTRAADWRFLRELKREIKA